MGNCESCQERPKVPQEIIVVRSTPVIESLPNEESFVRESKVEVEKEAPLVSSFHEKIKES